VTKPGPKRPRDPNQAAKQLIDIISGDVEDTLSAAKKDESLRGRPGGRKGGNARAKKLSPLERRDIARVAANARWKKRGG
jgi:hypothetical protein